ncbi:MAG: sporulation protein YunB [Christensenellales bacterium]
MYSARRADEGGCGADAADAGSGGGLSADRPNLRPLVFPGGGEKRRDGDRALNGALTEALEDVEYDDLMNVRMDDSGQVSLLSANTMRMNALADRAGDAALRKLETVSAQKVYVPLGAALGLTLFAGSGPRIPISIVPVGTVQTDFETEFEACGINQTRHKVYLQLSASIRIVIPTGAKTTNVSANMLVAESIIIGKVPESFVGYNLNPDELNMVLLELACQAKNDIITKDTWGRER